MLARLNKDLDFTNEEWQYHIWIRADDIDVSTMPVVERQGLFTVRMIEWLIELSGDVYLNTENPQLLYFENVEEAVLYRLGWIQ